MKIQYKGLSPVMNTFGTWYPMEIKNIPEDRHIGIGILASPLFDVVEEKTKAPSKTKRKWTRHRLREELQDKLERDNVETRETGGK